MDPSPITALAGPWRELSTYDSCQIRLGGVVYPSTEHAYAAAKTLDEGWRERILRARTCHEAKMLGRRAPLRRGWNDMRLEVMEAVQRQKFGRDPWRELLRMTGARELYHGNSHGDTFWGLVRGEGTNHLGLLLMRIREELV